MIVGADWKYYDFTPQQALDNFKKHKFVRKFIEGGNLVEAGAKMIPEGGYYSIPRSGSGAIGSGNCIILGDSAGFVNMLKIKGIHNALESGRLAGKAVSKNLTNPSNTADYYTGLVEKGNIGKEMRSAKNFRQTVAKFGNLLGFPLSTLGKLLPRFQVEQDYKTMKQASYRYKPAKDFDKDTFTAMAGTEHREDQPSHLEILDSDICRECGHKYKSPCIEFCPAGVYEVVNDKLEPANPSNCLHCKTCQRKCPYDNIRWTVPEGGGGPGYKRM
jgi:electron-transferring-flavoprotein dehydrogenase